MNVEALIVVRHKSRSITLIVGEFGEDCSASRYVRFRPIETATKPVVATSALAITQIEVVFGVLAQLLAELQIKFCIHAHSEVLFPIMFVGIPLMKIDIDVVQNADGNRRVKWFMLAWYSSFTVREA